jgi:thiamine pyrophosphokinase
MSRVIIFANGEFRDSVVVREVITPDDFVIGADGGTMHALSIGVVPNLVIGDLDSLSQEDLERVTAAGIEVRAYPRRKDETDLELALKYAAGLGAGEVLIFAALGGRLDQLIANVLLLTLPELCGMDVRIVDGEQLAFLIRGRARIDGSPGDSVSLIPIGGDVTGVTTTGLEWELEDDTLAFGPARGISNRITADQATVGILGGLLLCVLIHRNE